MPSSLPAIAILAGVATVRKLRALSKRWEDTHVPVIVKPGAYEAVLRDLVKVLDRAGLGPSVSPAPKVVSAPPKLLDLVAGRGLGALVPDQLMLITADGLEVLVYPSTSRSRVQSRRLPPPAPRSWLSYSTRRPT